MNEPLVNESRQPEESAPVQPIDCGRASDATRGLPFLLLFEFGSPPFNKMFLF